MTSHGFSRNSVLDLKSGKMSLGGRPALDH